MFSVHILEALPSRYCFVWWRLQSEKVPLRRDDTSGRGEVRQTGPEPSARAFNFKSEFGSGADSESVSTLLSTLTRPIKRVTTRRMAQKSKDIFSRLQRCLHRSGNDGA